MRDTDIEKMSAEELEKQLTKYEEINRNTKEYSQEFLEGKFIDIEDELDGDTLKLLYQDVEAVEDVIPALIENIDRGDDQDP